MNLLRYDAAAIGEGELSLGLAFFRKLQSASFFPFVSANLFVQDGSQPLGQRFLIKEVNGITVGITSVAAPSFFRIYPSLGKEIKVLDPVQSLNEILPDIRQQADLVVLLSHMGEAQTRYLVQNVSGIDVAVIGHDAGLIQEPVQAAGTLLVKNANKGMFLSTLQVSMNADSTILKTENVVKKLGADVVSDPEVEEILRKYKLSKRDSIREKTKSSRRNQVDQQLRENLKTLSPEEFVEQETKQNQGPPGQAQ